MAALLITLIAIWTYPIICFIVLRLTKPRPALRRHIFIISCIMTLLAVFGLITNISTTLSELDWIIVSAIYFTISFALAWTQFQSKKLIQILGILSMIIVFGLGYFSGTVGVLGIGFTVGKYDTEYEKWLGDGIIYKESLIGNAISDNRGKRIELYKTISWLPIIEWRTQVKEYYEYVPYMTTPLTLKYIPEKNSIYLSASLRREYDNKYLHWADTLTVENEENQ